MSKLYLETAGVVRGVLARRGSVRALCFDERAHISDRRACFALASSVLAHSAVLEPVVDALQERDATAPEADDTLLFPRALLAGPHGPVAARRALVMTMVHDMLFSRARRISGGGALKRVLEARAAEVQRVAASAAGGAEALAADPGAAEAVCYVRVNTLATTVDAACAELAGERALVAGVARDEHLPQCVLRVRMCAGVAPSRLNSSAAVRARRVIVQSKPSCMPPLVLAPAPGALCIDCCAAPGNKTSLLAALLANEGRIVAFDRDAERLATMRKLLANSRVRNVECRHQDFLTTSPDDPDLAGVQYILLDPSCSGSGLLDRPKSQRTAKNARERQRVRTLSHFQLQMLRHALRFGARRVVYSTCSIHREEDEEVVKLALDSSEGRYTLVAALPAWPRRGDTSVFAEADRCVRVDPDADGMTGFFVACFERTDCVGHENSESSADDGKSVQKDVDAEDEDKIEDEGEDEESKGEKEPKRARTQE